MSEALAFDAQSLRRTQSTGDVLPPPRDRLSTSHHHTEQDGRNVHVNPSQRPEGTSEDLSRNWFNPSTTVPIAQPQVGRSVTTTSQPRSLCSSLRLFFGIGPDASRMRKALVSVVWSSTYGFSQVAAIIAVLSVASITKNPTDISKSQINACERPLVVWNCIWIVRACLQFALSYWNFVRIRKADISDDHEPGDRNRLDGDGGPRRNESNRRQSTDSHGRATRRSNTGGASNQEELSPPYSYLYARLSLFSSTLTLTWYLIAHILEYTSVGTCRLSAPLVWWLTFAILCTMYFLVLEFLVFGFLIFMVLPFVMLCYSIILLCIGRRPLQNPRYSCSERGTIVDHIPLSKESENDQVYPNEQ